MLNDPSIISIRNEGQEVAETSFWRSEHARAGFFLLSIGGGAARLLIPKEHEGSIPDMVNGVRHVVISMLRRDQASPRKAFAEIMFEDGTETPFSLQLSAGQLDNCTLPENVGKEYVFTAWVERDGGPHKAISHKLYVQVVPRLPWLKPIEFKR